MSWISICYHFAYVKLISKKARKSRIVANFVSISAQQNCQMAIKKGQ